MAASKAIYLRSLEKSEIVQFIPKGNEVTLLRMSLSLTGCFSPFVQSKPSATVSVAAARLEYAKLRKDGYEPY